MTDDKFDVAIIGGGIVGCSVFFELTQQGYKCVMMEKNSDILSEASSGNSGMLHTGFDAPLNSLELDCVKSTQRSIFKIMDKFNTPYKKCGTVLVAWNSRDEAKLSQIEDQALKINVEKKRLTPSDLQLKEPYMKKATHKALFFPGESVVDPNLLGISFAHHARQQGSEILTSCEVKGFCDNVLDTSRGKISAHVAINCAGLYGDVVDGFVKNNVFSIKPRKGQYCIFDKSSNPLVDSIIFPVPSEKSKGVAVFKTVYGNVICGPTAQDVPERTRPVFDPETHKSLAGHAVSLIPDLNQHAVVGHYTGVRPATQFKDYQINAYPSENWITVGGIRSTGVSASLGIAQYVREKLIEEIGLEASRGSVSGINEIRWEYEGDSNSFRIDDVTYKAAHPICHFGFHLSASK